jgi:chromosomal replication initiation ATPase DnaA
MSQLALPLVVPETSETEFLVGESNAAAVHQLERWATWPVMAGVLTGPRKSGRSLLARIFAAKSGGTLIDDAERASETEIFHAWNRAQTERRPLLIVADSAPPAWQVRLPDLRSRLAATPVLTIGPPDDQLIPLLIARAFERRRLTAKPDLVAWIARRIERSHLALIRAVDAIEDDALRKRAPRLSIPSARATLAAAGLLNDPSGDSERP